MRRVVILLSCIALIFPSLALGAGIFDNYQMYRTDLSGTTYYLMFVTSRGGWYIKAIDTSTTKVYRVSYAFISDDTDYQSAVTDLSNHHFKTYEEAF